MSLGRLGFVGLLAVVTGAVTGCTGFADAASEARPADVAVPSYLPAGDAPEYCGSLAGSTHLTGIPAAMGRLAGEQGNVQAGLDLTAAIGELRTVMEQVETEPGAARIEAAIGELVEALTVAREDAVTTKVADGVSTALDELGRLVQPVCGFPS